MSAFRKIATGLASVLPFPLLLFNIYMSMTALQRLGEPSSMMLLPQLTFYASVGIIALFFIVDLFTNQNVRPDRRLLWIVVLLLGNALAFPVYWYLYIWRDSPPDTAAPQVTFCRWCGYEYEYPVEECVNCGRSMAGGTFVCTLNYGRVGAFLPYRNRAALWGYYMGVFSFVPAAGVALGPAAVLLGVKGLRAYREGPDNMGRGHAIAAIVLGGIGLGFNLAAGAAAYHYLRY